MGSATTGGYGGNSGSGSGGGLYAAATGTTAVTLHDALVYNNTAEAGRPGSSGLGYPGDGGTGGSDGGGFGGGVYLNQKASLTFDNISTNTASGGEVDGTTYYKAGTGLYGGTAGNGATGGGGGLYVAGGTVSVISCTVESNIAVGGAGGWSAEPAPRAWVVLAWAGAWMSKAAS